MPFPTKVKLCTESLQALLVKLSLAQTAEHYRFRDIVLCSSRRKLTDMPMAPPLGELAQSA